ncbi:imidazoleglycerol-phosphate dehydratase HisB [Candidatus Contubernalis alkalaceticus]|uniref:imidazoleglycerol-phosphate dehydratase HisB n=1 Tax=Candidatus Contubernalis alkaliaceticus TaxID=338645 RepID=UPI002A4E2689|nr:imidazoleglycerol-phosphate dehydratase HisB [Candidatus Contubernalis alkalaceticus]UNC92904.1 imidazoleglycerol-phosphate dehydratase HisB [Candidatus Contubernalis alkalaceticus]
MNKREAEIERKTNETDIKMFLNLDGTGKTQLQTGIPFLEHMLNLMARHGFFDLTLEASGDLEIDAHHLVEDIGIVLGQSLSKAVGSKEGIQRYGFFILPMDEALVMVSLDLSDRPFLVYNVDIPAEKVGDFDTELLEEFFRAFAYEARINLHLKLIHGKNSHHIIEALFKALGRSLDQALKTDPRVEGVPSTKGKL